LSLEEDNEGAILASVPRKQSFMNVPLADTGLTPSTADKGVSTLARLTRRVHMFTGLFLAPWMLMYALSTLAMTHRELVVSFYPSKTPAMVTERELEYTRTFPPGATPQEIGREILRDLGLEGTHRVSGGKAGKPLVINRQHAATVQRISFDPATRKLLLQREEYRTLSFLERMHRRRGYDQPYALEDTWGFSVDVAVIAMVFWSLSGLWLWWEIKSTRTWGTVSFVTGCGLFAIFLALL
jgi:hypothetical protein